MRFATRATWVTVTLLAAATASAQAEGRPESSAPPSGPAANVQQAQGERRIAVGQEFTDGLNRGDPQTQGRYPYHIWLFEGTAGQRVVAEVLSTEVHSELTLQDASGRELVRDERDGMPFDRRVDCTLPATGRYRLLVTTRVPLGFGAYRLRLTEVPPRRTALGQDVVDTLRGDDGSTAGRRPYHVWLLTGTRGQAVLITMQSGAVDAHVILEDSSGAQLALNDNDGAYLNARLEYTLPYTGQYRIRAGGSPASNVGHGGAYRLRVAAVPPERTRQIALGQEVTDTLADTDRRGGAGRASHTWRIAGAAGRFVTIEMLSDAVNALLILVDSTGAVLARDDSGGAGSNARLNYALPRSGVFSVIAIGVDVFRFGPYTLRVAAGRLPRTSMEGIRGSIVRGQTRTGALASGAPVIVTHKRRRAIDPVSGAVRQETAYQRSLYHAYLFRARGHDTLTIELESTVLDPLVVVQEADGEWLAEDDDGGEGLNSRLRYSFPYPGTFRIVVTSVGTVFGPYRLAVR